MKDDLIVINSFDDDLPLFKSTEAILLQRVEDAIHEAANNHDAQAATEICAYFQQATKLAGKSLAKALYTFFQRWEDFGIGEEFEDYIHARIGLSMHTIERYVRVAKLLEMLPDAIDDVEIRNTIKSKGIGQLIPIANAIAQGHEIPEEDWERLAEASNWASTAEIIRQVKHQERRETALVLTISRTGSIIARQGNGPLKFLGSLEINDQDETVQAGVNRIIENSGILKG